MIEAFMNEVRQDIERIVDSKTTPQRWGTTGEYNPSNHKVEVYLQPENIPLGELPIASLAQNPDGSGIWFAPVKGSMVYIQAMESDPGHYKVVGIRWPGTVAPANSAVEIGGPPVMLQPGQMCLKDPGGATLRSTGSGWLVVGDTQIQGNLTVSKNVLVQGNEIVAGTFQANSTAHIEGAVTLDSTLSTGGNVSVTGNVHATGIVSDSTGSGVSAT